MSKWYKQFLFGVWGLLLIPLIVPILKKWLEENVFSDPSECHDGFSQRCGHDGFR